ncbi:MAG: hypothetical protein DIU68_017210 [Chloroflexota bacterium]|nr:MAG: hypothetical protein DIU68_06910 [Chloroflexota bacterium]
MPQTTLPDYHFLYFAPPLGAEWFFDAARRYWERFRPTVLSDLSFLRFIPRGRSVIVTVVTRRDTVEQIGVELAQVRPDAYYDAVVQDLFADMKAVLNQRAERVWPFGVPLATAQPGPDNRLDPTPGPLISGSPVPTRAPSGFITQTPTPMPTAPVPTPDPGATTTGQEPIQPTPGPLIGG